MYTKACIMNSTLQITCFENLLLFLTGNKVLRISRPIENTHQRQKKTLLDKQNVSDGQLI